MPIRITLSVSEETNERLETLARENFRSKSAMVDYLVDREWRQAHPGTGPSDNGGRECDDDTAQIGN